MEQDSKVFPMVEKWKSDVNSEGTPNMTAVDVLKYQSYVEFLKDYYEAKQAQNRNFNYTVWSKKLSLTNVASLTRILNGERSPGDKILENFNQYFGFSNLEKEYFNTLVRLSKEEDYLVRSSLLDRLEILKRQNSIKMVKPEKEPLVILDSRVLLLWGEAKVDGLNSILSEFGLETILGYGGSRSTVCLKGGTIVQSKIGTYNEFNFANFVKRKGEPLSNSEMFFEKLYSSNQDATDFWNSWGSPYEMKAVKTTLDPIAGTKVASVHEEGREIFRMSFGMKETLESQQPMDMHGYNRMLGSKASFKMNLNSTAKYREYDSQIDECRWDTSSELGRFLEEVQFQPHYWTYHPNFKAKIFAPAPR